MCRRGAEWRRRERERELGGRETDSGKEDSTNDFLAQWVGSDT